jgi:2,3-bisphosphoglycerate-dependent phosphoglycerate mutase
MTELRFIRHGETDWNVQRRFQGQIDVPLNATGLHQAALLGARLAGDRADVLLSSDLQRARQTAAPLEAAWGLPAVLVPGLREQHFGVLEGLELRTIRDLHPDLWARWTEHRADYALPGGAESVRAFHTRVWQAVQALATQHAGRRVTVVTHGGVLDMLWRSAHGLPLDGAPRCAIPNTGVNRLRWVDGTLVVDQWADDSHLTAAGAAAPALADTTLSAASATPPGR